MSTLTAQQLTLLTPCRDLGYLPETYEPDQVRALQAADLLDDYCQITDAGHVALARGQQERLLRIANAGLLAWHGGSLIAVSDGTVLTDEDGDLASRLTHRGLLVESPAESGLTRIGITETGCNVLAGTDLLHCANPVMEAIRRRGRQPLRADDPDLLVDFSGEDSDPELTRDMAAAVAADYDDLDVTCPPLIGPWTVLALALLVGGLAWATAYAVRWGSWRGLGS